MSLNVFTWFDNTIQEKLLEIQIDTVIKHEKGQRSNSETITIKDVTIGNTRDKINNSVLVD